MSQVPDGLNNVIVASLEKFAWKEYPKKIDVRTRSLRITVYGEAFGKFEDVEDEEEQFTLKQKDWPSAPKRFLFYTAFHYLLHSQLVGAKFVIIRISGSGSGFMYYPKLIKCDPGSEFIVVVRQKSSGWTYMLYNYQYVRKIGHAKLVKMDTIVNQRRLRYTQNGVVRHVKENLIRRLLIGYRRFKKAYEKDLSERVSE